MSVSKKDRQTLRDLARFVAEIAALPVQQETINRWKTLNRLQPVRPMTMIDQIPWHEMDVEGELALQTEDAFCRNLETDLRRTLYRWKHLRADMVVESVIDVPKTIHGCDFGISIDEDRLQSDPQNEIVGHYYIDQLKTEADLQKIRTSQVVLDEAATRQAEQQTREIFDGLLAVRMQGYTPTFNLWDTIVQWHGVENTLIDLIDRPEFMHQIIARLTDAYLNMLDQLEEKGLLGHAQATIHCSGAFTDELPAPGFDPNRPRAKDLWTFGMAQIFSTVSADTHREFDIDYAIRWYSRFGLVYYGCCEPLHDKIDIIRKIPHVRKISMSPWVDLDKGAERIGRDFVFSRKPNPSYLAVDTWDPRIVERDLRNTRTRCARYGCPLEFILKDISTVRYQPQRLWEWSDIAQRVANE